MFCLKTTYLVLIISRLQKTSSNNEIFANQIKQGFNELIDKFLKRRHLKT